MKKEFTLANGNTVILQEMAFCIKETITVTTTGKKLVTYVRGFASLQERFEKSWKLLASD